MHTMTDEQTQEWSKLYDAIAEAGSDSHETFGGTWSGGYHIQQEPGELAGLLLALQGAGRINSYLQIGIAAGGSERFLCERLSIDELFVIDDGRHPNNVIWRRQNKAAIESRDTKVTEFIGSSHTQEAEAFLKRYGAHFDLIGIDGDHTPGGVRMDWKLIQPYIAKGTLVWFHDINLMLAGETGAREMWPKVKADPGFEVLLETAGKFGIGLVRKV